MKPELRNLWKKNLKANRKHFWAVAASGMMLLSIVFFTLALGDCMSVIATGRESDLLRGYATISTFMSTYILLFALLVINVIGYMKKRYFDYEMFTLLGIKSKHKNLMITYEYVGILLISVVGGILLGIIESEILVVVLENVFADSVTKVFYGFTPFGMTLVIGFLMFGLAGVDLPPSIDGGKSAFFGGFGGLSSKEFLLNIFLTKSLISFLFKKAITARIAAEIIAPILIIFFLFIFLFSFVF